MTDPAKSTHRSKPHYGWIILATGVAVMLACLGLGRFAIGMLLPSMGSSLNLNYGQMGAISTCNFGGYMLSVLFAGLVNRRMGARWTIAMGLATVGLSMASVWAATDLWTILLPYVLTGIGSGLANVSMMGLVTSWFAKQLRGRAAGCMLIGNGLGIVIVGILVPQLNLCLGGQGWRVAWLLLGIIALTVGATAGLLLRNDPAQMDQKPMRSKYPTAQKSAAAPRFQLSNRTTLVQLGSIYFLFGASHAVYATFIVTALVDERGFAEQAAGLFWSVVGVLSLLSGPLSGWSSDRLGRQLALVIVFVQFTLAYLLALAALPPACLYLSIGIFGLSLWGIPTIITATVGDLVGPTRAAAAFGFVTIFLGSGQVIGPALAGWLAQTKGHFDAAIWICAVLTAIAAVASATLLDIDHNEILDKKPH